MELDDSDVFILNNLAKLALSLKQYDVAQMAFEKVQAV